MDAAAPADLKTFFEDAEGWQRGMMVLSAAESLTDVLALDLLDAFTEVQPAAQTLLSALHMCDFLVERNAEWQFRRAARVALVQQLGQDDSLQHATHRRLLDLASGAGNGVPRDALPVYLRDGVGVAYHTSFLSPSEGERMYAQVAAGPHSGHQWLAAELSREQQSMGVLPANAIGPSFLQGITLYREGKLATAEPLLRAVANSDEARHEVAVAAHLVGVIDARRPRTRVRAESLLKRSHELLRHFEDDLGRAKVLHTLGQLVGRDRKRSAEAEELLRESLLIEERADSDFGRGQVLHTLGQLLTRDSQRVNEAEQLLRESLGILRELSNEFGQAQVLNTLGRMLSKQTQRREDAVELLQESLMIGRRLGDERHQAMVLLSLGENMAEVDPLRAQDYLKRSLEINLRRGDRAGRRRVRSALKKLNSHS